jgi:hypothetical protein
MNAPCRIRIVAGLLTATCFAAGATAAELTLYADDDYQGRALAVVIDERQLGVLNFNDRASSVVVENGAWVLCTDEDYDGQCITLEPGRYTSLQALGINDAITSVRRRDPANIGVFGRVETAARPQPAIATPRPATASATDIVLYATNDFGGVSQSVEQAESDLRTDALQGHATSTVIASGQWELCSDTFFRGQCVTLGPGKYASLETYGLVRGAFSVRRLPDPPHR